MRRGSAAERRPRLVHRRGDREGAALHAVRADDPLRPAARARDRGGARRRRARSASSATSSSTSTCAPIGGSSLTSDAPVPHDRDLDAAGIPVDLRAGAQHDLPLARARLGRGASARTTSSSASTRSTIPAIRTAGPSSSPRSSGSPTWRRAPASKAARFRVHTPLIALGKADIIRRGARARARLRPDPQLLRPGAGRAPVRHAATAACCAPEGFAEAGVPDPLLLG